MIIALVNYYASLIKKEVKTIDEVPEDMRKAVLERIKELETE